MASKEKITKTKFQSFQDIIMNLQKYWSKQGCIVLQPYDIEVGAGTFHPATTLRSLGPKPWKAAYVQPSRRPTDGRYGDNPNRFRFRPLRVGLRACGVVAIPIVTPLPDVTEHVVESEGIGCLLAHGMDLITAVITVPGDVIRLSVASQSTLLN